MYIVTLWSFRSPQMSLLLPERLSKLNTRLGGGFSELFYTFVVAGTPSPWWLAVCLFIEHPLSHSLLVSTSLLLEAAHGCDHVYTLSEILIISLIDFLGKISLLLSLPAVQTSGFSILPSGQRWVVPMRVTPATIRPRQGVRCQSWCLELDTASGPTLSVLSGTPKWRTSRAPRVRAARVAGRASRGSAGPWTPSWCGLRMSARGSRSRTRTCTTQSWAKCWVREFIHSREMYPLKVFCCFQTVTDFQLH